MKGTHALTGKVAPMRMFNTGLQFLQRLMKQAGPYMLVELLLPGGTLFTLVLFISRSGAWNALRPAPVVWQHDAQWQVLVERHAATISPAFVLTSPRTGGAAVV